MVFLNLLSGWLFFLSLHWNSWLSLHFLGRPQVVLLQLIEFLYIHHPSVWPLGYLLGTVIDWNALMSLLLFSLLPFCHEHLEWTIWWLLVMVSWLSWVVKSDSCFFSVTCFSNFSKQSSTHAVFDITSDWGSFTLNRRYSMTLLLHSSTATLTSAIQSSLNIGSSIWSQFLNQLLMQICYFTLNFQQHSM